MSDRLNPNPDPAKHSDIPLFNTETWLYEDFEIGWRLPSIRRTISEGEAMLFNSLVLDCHPYVADEIFAKEQGIFARRLGAGLMGVSYRLRFIKPVFSGNTIYPIRTNRAKQPKYPALGLVRVSYEVFKDEGELALYCEHLQTVKYRDPAQFADQVEKK